MCRAWRRLPPFKGNAGLSYMAYFVCILEGIVGVYKGILTYAPYLTSTTPLKGNAGLF